MSNAKINKDYSLHLTIIWYKLLKKSGCSSLSRVYKICGSWRRPYRYEDLKTCTMIVDALLVHCIYIIRVGEDMQIRKYSTVHNLNDTEITREVCA